MSRVSSCARAVLASLPGNPPWRKPAWRLSLTFDNRGARLSHPRGGIAFRLAGYGYADRLREPAGVSPTGAGNRVEYRRGDLAEWYVNGPQGLEQGFTFAHRPGSDPPGQPSAIALRVTGKLLPPEDGQRRGAIRVGPWRRAALRGLAGARRARPANPAFGMPSGRALGQSSIRQSPPPVVKCP
jgi:hypothetical protein